MEGIYLHVGLATPQMIFHKHSPQNVYDFKMLPTLLFWWRLLIVFFFRTWYIDVSCKLHGCSVYEADIHSWSERSCLKREAKKGGIDSFYVHLTRCCLIFFVLKIRVKDEYCAFLKNLFNNYRYDLLKYFVNSMTAITFVINICSRYGYNKKFIQEIPTSNKNHQVGNGSHMVSILENSKD